MNIFHKVTLQTLKKNRTRTIVTIIGIILSAAMICAVTTFASSIQRFLLDDAIYSSGDYYGSAYDVTQEKIEQLKQDERLSQLAVSESIGYAKFDGIINDYKPYLYVMGVDDTFMQTMPVHLISGTLPTDSTQVLIPEHLTYNGEVELSIGDTITLDIGQRIIDGDTQNPLTQNNPYMYDENGMQPLETLEVSQQKTYTVVGFYERPDFEDFSAPGYSVLTKLDPNETSGEYDIYFKTHRAKDIYDFMSDYDLGESTNTDVLMYNGTSKYNGFNMVLNRIATIFVVLIMFGSVSLIYNAFSISVSERTKQFGLLSSIGATKKQLKRSVRFEALFVSAIGIPIGILCGIGGIGATLYLLKDKMAYIIGGRVSLKVHVSWVSVLVAIAISLVTVFISVWIPSKRATRIDPITAIRQTNDITTKAKEVKTSKITYKLFGFEGMLAKKYFKRSRKKYRATILSLFMSVVLFISASAFSMYLTDSVKKGFETYGYDIQCTLGTSEDTQPDYESIYQQLKNTTAVTESAYTEIINTSIIADEEYLSDTYLNDSYAWSSTTELYLSAIFVNDDVYRQYLTDTGLDVEKYMNLKDIQGIVYDYHKQMDYDQGRYFFYSYLDYSTGEMNFSVPKQIPGQIYSHIDYDENGESFAVYYDTENDTENFVPLQQAYVETNLNIGQQIENKPWFVSIDFFVMYPMSAYDKISSLIEIDGREPSVNIMFKSSNHTLTVEKLEETLDAQSSDIYYDLTDYAQRAEQDRGVITVINVFAYGFIVLISLIAVANVFNTISTNIMLRRREFAMLKSVGMTRHGFNKIMDYECALYGFRALVLGLPVSILITYWIYNSINRGLEMKFYLPWSAIVIAVLSVFLVVFATMMYAMSKIKNDDLIDALKNENI